MPVGPGEFVREIWGFNHPFVVGLRRLAFHTSSYELQDSESFHVSGLWWQEMVPRSQDRGFKQLRAWTDVRLATSGLSRLEVDSNTRHQQFRA
jgi:hypothetical protein